MRRYRFTPGSVHVGFVVDNVALGQVFIRDLVFLLSTAIHWGFILLYHLDEEQ
jgi:hypothetical protein